MTFTNNGRLLYWLFCSNLGVDEKAQNPLRLIERPAVRTRRRPPSTHSGVLKENSGADSLQRNDLSPAALWVLSSMPSHTAGKMNFNLYW